MRGGSADSAKLTYNPRPQPTYLPHVADDAFAGQRVVHGADGALEHERQLAAVRRGVQRRQDGDLVAQLPRQQRGQVAGQRQRLAAQHLHAARLVKHI